MAIVSPVASFVWLCGIGSIVAVITGHMALRQIDRSGGEEDGRPLAIVGLIFGYLGLIVAVVAIVVGVINVITSPSTSGMP